MIVQSKSLFLLKPEHKTEFCVKLRQLVGISQWGKFIPKTMPKKVKIWGTLKTQTQNCLQIYGGRGGVWANADNALGGVSKKTKTLLTSYVNAPLGDEIDKPSNTR